MGLLIAGVAPGEDEKPPDALVSVAPKPNFPQLPAATSPTSEPLNLLLTQAELRWFIRNFEIRTGEVLTDPIDEDEVVVIAPHELAPMRDVSQDVAGGIAAPFWAIMHPKAAWRIFLPIPPKPDRK